MRFTLSLRLGSGQAFTLPLKGEGMKSESALRLSSGQAPRRDAHTARGDKQDCQTGLSNSSPPGA